MEKFQNAPSLRPELVSKQKQLLKNKVEVASILRVSPLQLAKMIAEVEEDPLFQKLFYSQSNQKVIHRKKFQKAALSSQFYELPENAPSAPPGVDVEQILESKKNLIQLIQKIGQGNFETYFLFNDGGYSLEGAAQECKITIPQAEEIRHLLNKIFVNDETFAPTQFQPAPGLHYSKVARILSEGPSDFSIAFHSPRMAQGLYDVDHQKLKELKKEKMFSLSEKKSLRDLLFQIHLINVMKNSLYQLILKIAEFQKDFIVANDRDTLHPLTQKEIASQIHLSPSSVCRLIFARSIETISGKEVPLEFFFCSRKEWLKIRLEKLFSEEGKNWTDHRVVEFVREKYAIALSRRSINQYRKEITG